MTRGKEALLVSGKTGSLEHLLQKGKRGRKRREGAKLPLCPCGGRGKTDSAFILHREGKTKKIPHLYPFYAGRANARKGRKSPDPQLADKTWSTLLFFARKKRKDKSR